MRLLSAELFKLAIPFRMNFRHARHFRSCSDNLILKVTLENGSTGYGECLVRSYVTGESADSVITSFTSEVRPWLSDLNLGNQEQFQKALRPALSAALPRSSAGAFCLADLALTDAYGKHLKFNAATSLGAASNTLPPVYYSFVLGKMRASAQILLLLAVRAAGLRHIKCKVGFGESDLARLRLCRQIMGQHCRLGVDANGAWDYAAASHWIDRFRQFGVEYVEEPLRPDQRPDLGRLIQNSPIPIVLDESLCDAEQAQTAVSYGPRQRWNLRVSKNGGLWATNQLCRMAKLAGIPCHVGAMVGETGILAAAGRQFAQVNSPQAVEGSYGSLLLRQDICQPSVLFGYGGKGRSLRGYGLGVQVNEGRLKKYATWRASYSLC